MRVTRSGENVIVRFDKPASGARSLALVRASQSSGEFTREAERVMVDAHAREAIVVVPEAGAYELLLSEGGRVIARARVTIEGAPVARQEPPVWYW